MLRQEADAAIQEVQEETGEVIRKLQLQVYIDSAAQRCLKHEADKLRAERDQLAEVLQNGAPSVLSDNVRQTGRSSAQTNTQQ